MAVNEHLFPDLARTGYRITSPPDPIYNCIAHAAGFTGVWWWPDPDGFDYWPLENGHWSSKLGPDDDIEHPLHGLFGATYGSAVQFLRRSVGQK